MVAHKTAEVPQVPSMPEVEDVHTVLQWQRRWHRELWKYRRCLRWPSLETTWSGCLQTRVGSTAKRRKSRLERFGGLFGGACWWLSLVWAWCFSGRCVWSGFLLPPGLASQRDCVLTANPDQEVLSNQRGHCTQGKGPKDPSPLKGRGPRTLASRRRWLLRVVVATAGAWWFDCVIMICSPFQFLERALESDRVSTMTCSRNFYSRNTFKSSSFFRPRGVCGGHYFVSLCQAAWYIAAADIVYIRTQTRPAIEFVSGEEGLRPKSFYIVFSFLEYIFADAQYYVKAPRSSWDCAAGGHRSFCDPVCSQSAPCNLTFFP